MKGWRYHTDGSPAHAWPADDIIDHDVDSVDCPCGPTFTPVRRDDGSVGWTITHHSLDGREVTDMKLHQTVPHVAEPLDEWAPGHWCDTCNLPSLWLRKFTTTRNGTLCGVTTVSWCDECEHHCGNHQTS